MKRSLPVTVSLFLALWGYGQTVSQLTIQPLNPKPTDVISIISKINYQGNCSYGLVHTNTSVAGSTVQIMPLYCGHGQTTTCTEVDTFRIGPFPAGYYQIEIEY